MGVISANNIKIGGDTSGLIASIGNAGLAIRGFTLDVNSKLVDAFKRADKEQRVFRSGLTRLGDDLTKIGTKFGMFGALPALFAAGKAYKDFADIQKLEAGLNQYGESLERVKELAKLPNVSIEGAASSLIGLRAAGMNAALAERAIKGFANALTAAGKSSADLQPALANIVQMLGNGMISAADVKEMANRAPQVRKILLETFKTTSGEELSKLGVENVVEGLIAGLEKIPPVAGGAGMAMEQFGDSFKFASSSIGEMIDKSFNVSGIIGKMGDALDNITDHLRALSPEAQKSILAVGSMAVIIPTVTTAIGGMIKLLPLLATGFGLGSGPVAAVVAGIAIGSAAIIANWDKVKAALQDSGFWQNITGIAKTSLNLLAETVKLGLNLIQGDWGNFGNALLNIGKNLWNGIAEQFAAGVKFLVNAMRPVADILTKPFQWAGEKMGMDFSGFGKGIIDSIDKFTGKLKFDVPDATDKVTQGFKGWAKSVSNLINGGGDGGAGGGLKGATGAVESLTKAEYELWRINLESKHLKDAQAVKSATEEYKKLAGAIAGVTAKSIDQNNKSYLTPYGQVKRDERMSPVGKIKPLWGKSSDHYSALSEEDFRPADGAELMKAIPQKLGETHKEYQKRLAEWKETSMSAGANISGALREAAGASLEAVGDLVGNLMSGVDGLQNFGLRLGEVLSGLLRNLGKSLISFGTAGIAIKKFITNPYTALIAGVGLIALSTALKNNISAQVKSGTSVKLAGGGAAYGETLAVIGDNRNAAFNPELVAPADHVRRYIADAIREHGGGGGNGDLKGEFRIKGPDLILAIERTQRMQKSTKGRNA